MTASPRYHEGLLQSHPLVEVNGGYRALFRFELPACYHPNLGIFWGVWHFQKKNSSKNVPFAGQITFFENTMANPFDDFFKY